MPICKLAIRCLFEISYEFVMYEIVDIFITKRWVWIIYGEDEKSRDWVNKQLYQNDIATHKDKKAPHIFMCGA